MGAPLFARLHLGAPLLLKGPGTFGGRLVLYGLRVCRLPVFGAPYPLQQIALGPHTSLGAPSPLGPYRFFIGSWLHAFVCSILLSVQPILPLGVSVPPDFCTLRPQALTPKQFLELTAAIFGRRAPRGPYPEGGPTSKGPPSGGLGALITTTPPLSIPPVWRKPKHGDYGVSAAQRLQIQQQLRRDP